MMKTLFPHYYRPSDDEFRGLWKDCVFALDANVLLNVYGYSETTREQLLALLERLSPRIRMPYQFALEYQRNRIRAIMEQVKNYAKTEKALEDLYNQELVPKHKHPFLSDAMLLAFTSIQDDLSTSRKKHESLFANDPYFDRVTAIVKSVGSPPATLDSIFDKARARYAAKIPPGYADLKDKGEPDAFGDYVGWVQLMEISKSEGKPLILVTDDAKEDWWQLQSDRTIGPRPELICEFLSECHQQFYMYSSDRFMAFARDYLEETVEPSAIEEIKQRRKEQLRNVSDTKPISPPSQLDAGGDQKPVSLPETHGVENLKPISSPLDLKVGPIIEKPN